MAGWLLLASLPLPRPLCKLCKLLTLPRDGRLAGLGRLGVLEGRPGMPEGRLRVEATSNSSGGSVKPPHLRTSGRGPRGRGVAYGAACCLGPLCTSPCHTTKDASSEAQAVLQGPHCDAAAKVCTCARASAYCARRPLHALHKIGPPISPAWQLEAVLIAETPLAHNHLIAVACSGWWGALAAGQRGKGCIGKSRAAMSRRRLCDACLKHSPNCASGRCCSAGRAIAVRHTPLTGRCPSS